MLHGGVEGIAVDMNDVLREISGGVKLSNELVGGAELPGQIELLKSALLLNDLVDLLRQNLVLLLFPVEELGTFRCIVDDLRNLEDKAKA